MKLIHTKSSRRDFQKLPYEIQERAHEKFKLFFSNPSHPSLGVKKIQGHKNIWEGRVTQNYRFTFQKIKDIYILRRIGKHQETLKKP